MSGTITAERESVEVSGRSISYRVLGHEDVSTVLLVHGGAAHSGWWNGVAPRLAETYRVVLPDLGGHGRSGHGETYTAERWAEEMAAVLRRTTSGPAAVVGHSMGGLVGVATAAHTPELVELVLVDTRLPLHGLPAPDFPARLYGSAQDALDRFRLMPDQTSATPDLLLEIAREGLVETADGWRWRFDPAARRRLTNDGVSADIAALTCPVGYLYGEGSDMGGPGAAEYLQRGLGRDLPVESVPDAFHHVPLDQPELCADAIARMLSRLDWR